MYPSLPVIPTIWLKKIGLVVLVGLGLLVGLGVGQYSLRFGHQPLLLLGVPLALPLVALLIINPRGLFYMLLISRCALDPVLDSARFSSSIGLGAILNVLVVACAALICLQAPKERFKQCMALWIAPLLVMALGVTYSPDPLPAIKRMVAFTSYFATFTVALVLVYEGELRKLLRVVMLSSIIPMLAGIWQIVSGALYPEGRLNGTFTHPNIFAFYCLLVLVVLAYVRTMKSEEPGQQPTRFENLLFYTLLPLLVFSIALTQTRSAWAALMLMGVIYGVMVSRATLLWLAIGLVIAAFIPAVQDRVMDLMQGNEVVQYAKLNSFAWRQYIWETGLSWMSPTRYLLGYGIGGFFHHSVDFFPLSGGMPFGAHNVFVERFFDGGLLAVSVFAAFFVIQFYWATRLLRKLHTAGLAYVGLILTYLTLNASDNVVDYLAYNWYYWAVAGAMYAQARIVGKANTQHGQ